MKSPKKPISSYTILFFITIFVGLLSYVVPSGTFFYKNPTTNEIIKTEHITQSQITKERLVPLLETFHLIENKTASAGDILVAPIVGAIRIIEFVLLILMLGIFLEMLKSLKTFEMLIELIIKYRLNYKTTALLSLFVVSILSSATGLRDENIVFLGLLAPLFNFFGFSLLASGVIVLLSTIIGITSSLLNPTIIGIFASLSGYPISDGVLIRLLVYIVLYVSCGFILLRVLKTTMEPSLTDAIPESRMHIGLRSWLSTISLFIAFGVFMFCLLNDIPLVQTQGYLLGLTILSGIIGGLKEHELVGTIQKGTRALLPIAINISIARGILYILEKTEIKDTLLYASSKLLGADLNIVFFSFFFIVLIFLFYLLMNSTSAISSLVFPLLYPLVIPHNVPYSIFIVWFLIATGFSQIFNPSGFLLSQIRLETSLSYSSWSKIIYPIPLVLIVIWIISLFFV